MTKAWQILILNLAIHSTSQAAVLGEWCGSRRHGDLNNLIPDSFRPQDIPLAVTLCGWVPGGPSANFRPACRDHDSCYWTLGVERKQCDSRFRDDLEQICRDTYHADHRKRHKSCCIKAAFYYEAAVVKMGGDSYRSAQDEAQYAANLYEDRTGKQPDFATRKLMAELCIIHNDANGNCNIEYVVDRVIK